MMKIFVTRTMYTVLMLVSLGNMTLLACQRQPSGLDVTPPDTEIVAGPCSLTNSTTARFELSASEQDCDFECSLDQAAWAGCARQAVFNDLAHGLHHLQVRAVDSLGNADPVPATYGWEIDTLDPETEIELHPPELASQSMAVFSYSCSETLCAYQCTIDGQSWSACSNPALFSLPDGNHSLAVQSHDLAGNSDRSPDIWEWTIDTAPPITYILSGPPAQGISDGASFELGCSEERCIFECQLDGASFAPCASPVEYTRLEDGLHLFQGRARDLAGNLEVGVASYPFEVTFIWSFLSLNSASSASLVRADGTLWFRPWAEYDEPWQLLEQEPSASTDWEYASSFVGQVCAIKHNGSLWCWGSNADREAIPDAMDYYLEEPIHMSPEFMDGETEWSQVSAGYSHTCGIGSTGILYCWGLRLFEIDTWEYFNGSISLGWRSISAGKSHNCGIKIDGALWCFGGYFARDQYGYSYGGNDHGQYGIGSTEENGGLNQELTLATDWEDVAVGENHTCAVKTGGALYCWGGNEQGQLGDGTTDERLVPVQEGTGTLDWETIAAGSGRTCGIKTDQSLWCWGRNDDGHLPVDQPGPVLQPIMVVQPYPYMRWSQVGVGIATICALTAEGRLWCWPPKAQ